MKSNLTYELLHSKPQGNFGYHSMTNDKYGKSWNSPKSKLKNTIAKIDEELLSIKEKIKNVQNTPQRSLSRFSIQYLSHKKTDFDMDMRYGELINEVSQKELIFQKMINDMKILEATIEEFHYANIDLAHQLDNERELKYQMDQERQNMIEKLNQVNSLEEEIFRLKEDNIRMYKIIEDSRNKQMIQRKNSALWREQDYAYDNNGNQTHDTINTHDNLTGRINTKSTLNLTPQPKNEICYCSEQRNSRLKSFQENNDEENSVTTRYYGQYDKTRDNSSVAHLSVGETLCPHHQDKKKSKSVDHYSYEIKETNEEKKRNLFNNPSIIHKSIDEDNSENVVTLSNFPENRNQISKEPIQISSIKKKGQCTYHQPISQFSVIENHSHEETENNQVPSISDNQRKMGTLIEKIDELTANLNQTQNELENRLKELEAKEKDNKYLKDQIEDNKTQANDQSLTFTDNHKSHCPSPLSEQSIFQFTVCPNNTFVNHKDEFQLNQPKKSFCKKSDIFSKLKINNSTLLDDSLNKTKIKLSNNLLFKPYDKKRLLCFDITNYKFSLIDFIDYSNYDSHFQKNGIIYANHEDGIFIITGENNDYLYSYTHYNKAMNKLSNLSNNHSYGGLVSYSKISTNENCLVCLSGWYNKKVEEYSTNKNEWNTVSEMKSERGESSFLVCNNEKIFAFFGYNCPQKKYINTIEYCHINKSEEEDYQWNIMKYSYQGDSFSLFIKAHSLLMINSYNFVLIGGYDGKDNMPVENFIQATTEQEDTSFTFNKVNRKLFGIDKNHVYNFDSDFTSLSNSFGTVYQICFDKEERVHSINIKKMSHEIFSFD